VANGSYWREIGYDLVRSRLDTRIAAYRAAAAGTGPELPLVSCIMPTRDRPELVALSIEKFQAQDYPHKELIVLDDGRTPLEELADPSIRYVRMDRDYVTVGEKRAIACRLARGEVISVWDDDDWYTPERLRCQVMPIVYGEADMTGLRCDHLLCLPSGDVWQVNDEVHRCMFESDVAGGTITFRREILDDAHFPAIDLAEDAALIRMARARGWRLKRIANHGVFAYVRHARNTWRFEPGQFYDPGGWSRAELPARFSPVILDAHREAFRLSQDRHAHSGAAF
jgi:glycosyltransferase involved in cell wall biosynthesis